MSDLVLYNYFRSSTSYRIRIALHWKGLPFEYRPVHLLKDGGEQNKSQYRNLNPMGGVPTLQHKGRVIAQTMAILEYLEECFPQKPLLPADLYERALVRQICENINSDIHPLGNLKVTQYLTTQLGVSEEAKQQWLTHWITQGFSAVEEILEKTAGTYCVGNTVTAADVFLIPQVVTAQRFHISIDAFPHLKRIFEVCSTLPEFQAAHPGRQIDTPAEFKI